MYELITQEESMGCGIACVASRIGEDYQSTRKLFSDSERSLNEGYYCEDLIEALEKKGLKYGFKEIKEGDEGIVNRTGTIVFAKRGDKYPEGHWLLKTEKGWMNSWFNWPSKIKEAVSGYDSEFPGIPEWVVYEIG
jgi:hypothetical protein